MLSTSLHTSCAGSATSEICPSASAHLNWNLLIHKSWSIKADSFISVLAIQKALWLNWLLLVSKKTLWPLPISEKAIWPLLISSWPFALCFIQQALLQLLICSRLFQINSRQIAQLAICFQESLCSLLISEKVLCPCPLLDFQKALWPLLIFWRPFGLCLFLRRSFVLCFF